MNELYHNPERLINTIRGAGIQPELLLAQIQKEIDAGNIRALPPRHLIVNMLSLCVFPFAGKPIIKGVLFRNDEEQYRNFLMERKTEVTLFIMNALKVD
jgi:hypothetical protein